MSTIRGPSYFAGSTGHTKRFGVVVLNYKHEKEKVGYYILQLLTTNIK